MKKRFLAFMALLCSVTVCATVGVTAMNKENAQVVSAEAVTSTWTDTAGTTYTFEGDVRETRATITTTDLGDIGPNEHRLPLATATGLTGEASNMDNVPSAGQDASTLYLPDQAWTGETSGLHFAFKTEGAWYKPAGTLNGEAQISDGGRISIFYGDIMLELRQPTDLPTALTARIWTMVDAGKPYTNAIMSWKTIERNTFFSATDAYGKKTMADYSEIKIARYKCTSASGYYLKIYISVPGTDFATSAYTIYDGYVNAPMSSSTFDYFAIRNGSLGYAGVLGYKISEAGYDSSLQNRLSIRRGDLQVKATVATETYKDVADMTDINKTLAEDFTMGLNSANISGYKPTAVGNDIYSGNTKSTTQPIGIEFRTKHVDGGTAIKTKTISECFMLLNVGTECLYVNYNATYGAINFQPVPKVGSGSTIYGRSLLMRSPYLTVTPCTAPFTYDPSAEYAWRITYSPVQYTNGDTTMNEKGAMVRIYMGKVDATTGMPASDWANKPLFEFFSILPTKSTYTGGFGLGVDSTMLDNNDSHEMVFSSNKYVGIKTIIGEESTMTPVVRGGSYTLTPMTGEGITQIGWSKGAEHYTEDDFVVNNKEFTDLRESATYTALGFKLEADEKAAIRFRVRTVDGVKQPLELSLKWNVTVTDIGNAGYYFGSIAFGYKLTASNGATTEKDVKNVSDGIYTDYTYGVIQSNITADWYTIKFVCQGYVRINGQTYYTDLPDMDEYGRSVDYIADMATNDIKDVAGEYNGVMYNNAIIVDGVTKYHYLTQEQYDLVKKVGAVNL